MVVVVVFVCPKQCKIVAWKVGTFFYDFIINLKYSFWKKEGFKS
jgi:hypothetical protein